MGVWKKDIRNDKNKNKASQDEEAYKQKTLSRNQLLNFYLLFCPLERKNHGWLHSGMKIWKDMTAEEVYLI